MITHYRVRRNDKIDAAVQGRAERLLPEGATEVQQTPENDETAREGGSVNSDATGT
jgi:hypothetical protein